MKVQRKWISIELPENSTYELKGADVIATPFGSSGPKLRIMSLKNPDGKSMKISDLNKYIQKSLILKKIKIRSGIWSGIDVVCRENESLVTRIWGLISNDLMVIVSLIGNFSDHEESFCENLVFGISKNA